MHGRRDLYLKLHVHGCITVYRKLHAAVQPQVFHPWHMFFVFEKLSF